MVLTASFVLSPVTGLSCHRRLRSALRKLDTSVGVSGPHDFAVRFRHSRQKHHPRPSHPAPNVRDDREAPLLSRRDGVGFKGVSINWRNELFFQRGLDDPNQLEFVR
jgi:hypothetical protein